MLHPFVISESDSCFGNFFTIIAMFIHNNFLFNAVPPSKLVYFCCNYALEAHTEFTHILQMQAHRNYNPIWSLPGTVPTQHSTAHLQKLFVSSTINVVDPWSLQRCLFLRHLTPCPSYMYTILHCIVYFFIHHSSLFVYFKTCTVQFLNLIIWTLSQTLPMKQRQKGEINPSQKT